MEPTEPVASPPSAAEVGAATLSWSRIAVAVLYGLLLTFGLFLLGYQLDSRLLWGDEAETATLARNVVRFGYPKTVDGLDRISLFGVDIDNAGDAWVWSPWLQEYVAAASFSGLGATTWAARAPFALLGWLCLPLLAWTAYRIYRRHAIVLASMAWLATSEVFLLHARQCRYYAIVVLAEILFVGSLYCWVGNERKGRWLLGLSLTIQFYANYIVAVANLPVLALLGFDLYRRDRRELARLGRCLLWPLLLAAPWVLYARAWRQSAGIAGDALAGKLLDYARELHFHFVPLPVFALPLGAWLVGKRRAGKSWRRRWGWSEHEREAQPPSGGDARPPEVEASARRSFERLLLFLLPSYALVITLAPGTYLRYLLPLLPVACLLATVWLFRHLRHRLLAVAIVGGLCLSNALAWGTGGAGRGSHELRWPLFDFVAGLTVPYHDRLEDVVGYLRREARPGQTIFVFDPEFPLRFYTPCRIIDGRLHGSRLPDPLPDWLLLESASGVLELPVLPLPAVLRPFYDAVTLSVHATFRGASIPEPDLYRYRSAPLGSYLLYRKKTAPP